MQRMLMYLAGVKTYCPKVRFNNQNSIINLKKVLKNTFHAEMFLILHGKQRERRPVCTSFSQPLHK